MKGRTLTILDILFLMCSRYRMQKKKRKKKCHKQRRELISNVDSTTKSILVKRMLNHQYHEIKGLTDCRISTCPKQMISWKGAHSIGVKYFLFQTTIYRNVEHWFPIKTIFCKITNIRKCYTYIIRYSKLIEEQFAFWKF